jgi:hypothetical protein
MKSQWISGLNNVFYMVRPHHPKKLQTLSNCDSTVRDAYLCLHPRSYRPQVDPLLGIRRPRNRHVSCWRLLQARNQR